jgi:hypothetical protein
MNKKIIYLIVGLIVIAIALFAFNKLLKEEVVEEPIITETPEEEQVEIISVNNLIVPDQAPGAEVFVEKVLLKTDEDGGFVVIHRVTEDGDTGEVIGVSRYLEPGITENLVVVLNEDETVEVGETVTAILYADDGNGVWNSETDMPITDDEGIIIQATFTILDNLEDIPGFEAKL